MSGISDSGEWFRMLALASYALPPSLAVQFSEAQRAVLAVIGLHARSRWGCVQSNSDLARAADVRPSVVEVALKKAREAGLIRAEARFDSDGRRATNRYHIQSDEWAAWLGLR